MSIYYVGDNVVQILRQDFWICTPCHSLRTGLVMEGTRLTVQVHQSIFPAHKNSARTPHINFTNIQSERLALHQDGSITTKNLNMSLNYLLRPSEALTLTKRSMAPGKPL